MAERLTECIDSHLLDNGEMVKEYSLNSKIELNHFSCMDIPNAVYDKLGELEDILEKYGIGIQKLDYILEDYSKNQGRCFAVCEERDTLRQERDVWKRACELACREAPLHCPNPPKYYNAQDEYGSDEPYYIQESACEFSDDAERCLECQINYFYQQAKNMESNNDNR